MVGEVTVACEVGVTSSLCCELELKGGFGIGSSRFIGLYVSGCEETENVIFLDFSLGRKIFLYADGLNLRNRRKEIISASRQVIPPIEMPMIAPADSLKRKSKSAHIE